MSTLATATALTAPASARAARPAPLSATIRFELTKLLSPWRFRVLLALCLVGPAAFVGAVSLQGALPSDTIFGRWMHQSGWAAALVMLAFCCSWALPLAAAVIAADVLASEDRLGTWRHLVMSVRSIPRIVTAKVVASLVGIGAFLLALAVSSILGGLLFVGNHPLVGLDGQSIGTGRAAGLVIVAWVFVGIATLAWAAVGLLGAALMGRSPASLLLPPVLALALQMSQMLPLPTCVRLALPSNAFLAWRGLFTDHVQTRSLMAALAVNLTWTLLAAALARRVMLRRDFTDLAYDGAPRRAVLVGLAPLVALAACTSVLFALTLPDGAGITRSKVEASVSSTFAHLYRLQTTELHRPDVTEAQLATAATCDRGGDLVADRGAGNDWRCVVTWHVPGASATGSAIYQLDVAPDGRVVADGDGPTDVNGYFVVQSPNGPVANPTWQVDGLVDLLAPQ